MSKVMPYGVHDLVRFSTAHRRLAQAIEGHGSLVLVSGEAGIGKTTLVADLARQAEDDGVLILNGGCYDLNTPPPYGPWSEAVRGYHPDAGWPPAPAWLGVPEDATTSGSQLTLFEEAQRFFSQLAERRPVSIILEDLHWADPASLDLMSIGEQDWERSIGMTITVAHPSHSRLLVDILEGCWSEARQQATKGLSAAGPDTYQSAVVNLGILARNQGELDLAWRQVEALLPDGPDTEPGDSWFALAHAAQRLAAELALDAHDLDLAHRWIEAHGYWLKWSGAKLWQPHHHRLQAHFHHQADDFASARHHADEALLLATTPRQPLILIAIQRLLGELATAARRFDSAEAHFARSAELADRCAAPYEQALTLLALANAQLAAGNPETVKPLLNQARAICTRLQPLQP